MVIGLLRFSVGTPVMLKLQTERTIIETISLDDADFFVSLVNTPDWLRFIGDRRVKTADEAKQFLQSGFLRSYRENGFGYYLVRTLDRDPIGICGFLKKPELTNVDFGFAFLPEFCGRGFGFESATAVLDYGATAYRFRVLDAVTLPDNKSSIRLLSKLGFIRQCADDDQNEAETVELYRWKISD